MHDSMSTVHAAQQKCQQKHMLILIVGYIESREL